MDIMNPLRLLVNTCILTDGTSMPINVTAHIYLHGTGDDDRKLDLILKTLETLTRQGVTIMAALDTLTAQVTKNTDVEQSAIVLLNGLSAQIASLKNDPVALQALADKLSGSSDALAAAIVANTPVETLPPSA